MKRSAPPLMPAPPETLGTVAIVGLGLLGASLALRLRRQGTVRVLGVARRAAVCARALDLGMVDEAGSDPGEALARADLTVLCVPVAASIEFATRHAAAWRAGAVVTDVGSVKADIVCGVRPALQAAGVHFVGAHPMAGSEQSGIEHAVPDLYNGATVFLTPTAEDSPQACDLVARFWESVGAQTFRIDAQRHDAIVARTSHALHLAASAAVLCALANGDDAGLATGGGFRDFTRIAGSSPEMWTEIARHNRDHVMDALGEFSAQIERLRQMLESGDWSALNAYLDSARVSRAAWFKRWQEQRREAAS